MYSTPKRNKLSHDSDSDVNLTPTRRIFKSTNLNIEDKEPVNGSPSHVEKNGLSPGEARRGRPRAELLNTLILEGSTSPSSIKCTYCGRVFPREKSLQAHLRTHTGEKPYICDYPRCTRKFAQSGQLKTHQRLHTGEKPFICAASHCSRRFTHANRHCPDHPDLTLRRYVSRPEQTTNRNYDEAHNAEIREWLQNWDRRNKTTPKSNENLDTTPKKSIIFKREESVFSSGSSAYFSSCSQSPDDVQNSPKSELDDLDTSLCSSEGELTTECTPKCLPSELPKKRWLREAVQDKRLWDSTNDLACPINWGEEVYPEPNDDKVSENVENQNRPSVLVCVQGGKRKEISNDDIQGAMALVELKNGLTCNFNYRI